MKPSQLRLDRSSYPFSVEIATRFADMDVLRHLNNVALAGVYEEVRMRFGALMDTRSHWDAGHRVVVGEVAIRYLGEGRYPEPIHVGVGVAEIACSSYRLSLGMFQDDRCIGVCDSVLVYVNMAESRARPLPDALRTMLETQSLVT